MWSLEADRPEIWIWICPCWVHRNLGIDGGWGAKKCCFCFFGGPLHREQKAKGPPKATRRHPNCTPEGEGGVSVLGCRKQHPKKDTHTHTPPPGVAKRGPEEPKWAPEPRPKKERGTQMETKTFPCGTFPVRKYFLARNVRLASIMGSTRGPFCLGGLGEYLF